MSRVSEICELEKWYRNILFTIKDNNSFTTKEWNQMDAISKAIRNMWNAN